MKKIKATKAGQIKHHYIVQEMMKNDAIDIKHEISLDLLEEKEPLLLFEKIALDVIESDSGEYVQISHSPLFCHLMHSHSTVLANVNVHLKVHSYDADEQLYQLITFLNITYPLLQQSVEPSLSKTISARHRYLNRFYKALISKSALAGLVGKDKSFLRGD